MQLLTQPIQLQRLARRSKLHILSLCINSRGAGCNVLKRLHTSPCNKKMATISPPFKIKAFRYLAYGVPILHAGWDVCSRQYSFDVFNVTVKPVLNDQSQKFQNLVFKTNYCLMQVNCIAECSKGSILQYFDLH